MNSILEYWYPRWVPRRELLECVAAVLLLALVYVLGFVPTTDQLQELAPIATKFLGSFPG